MRPAISCAPLLAVCIALLTAADTTPRTVIRGDAGSPRASVWEASHSRVEAQVKTKTRGLVDMYFLSLPEMYATLRHEYGPDFPLVQVRVLDDSVPADEAELIDGEKARYLYYTPPQDSYDLPAVKAFGLKRHVRREQKRLENELLELSWEGLLSHLSTWYEANEAHFEYQVVESPLTPKDRGKAAPPPGGGRGR